MTEKTMPSHARMMAEHFGISILESDAQQLHGRIQMLLATAHARGMEVAYDRVLSLKFDREFNYRNGESGPRANDIYNEIVEWKKQT